MDVPAMPRNGITKGSGAGGRAGDSVASAANGFSFP